MTSSDTSALIVAIDLRKNRIRVHKETLHRLNDPNYIHDCDLKSGSISGYP